MNQDSDRREFLKNLGLASTPFLLGTSTFSSFENTEQNSASQTLNFVSDGLMFSPQEYLSQLEFIGKKGIRQDFYGNGGVTTTLEATFAEITGKEKAIYLPTGTMANQLAIKLLNGPNTKAIVPENSHVFRDEADAAQSVHNKRLLPVGKGKAFFDLTDLKSVIDYTNNGEVFKSGLGTVVIETPVRRADGQAVPLSTLKEISQYCRNNGYKLHLDGARIHLASAFTGVSVKAYSDLFDTVYISLYKYLNAAGGAMLCGDAKLIDQVAHQIKILGGTVYQTWVNTAMAHHYLSGIDQRWSRVRDRFSSFQKALNEIAGVSLKAIPNGSNIFDLTLDSGISAGRLGRTLATEHNIRIRRVNAEGTIKLFVNESLLHMEPDRLIEAWKCSIAKAKS